MDRSIVDLRRSAFAKRVVIAALLLGVLPAFAEDATLDSTKYPQDTPQKALGSIIKAMEGKESEYWLAWLVTPDDTKRVKEKYETITKAVAAHQDEKHAELMKQRLELMKKMQSDNKTTAGDENGMKWTRFTSDDKVLELDLQADGRWCMNMKVTRDQDKK